MAATQAVMGVLKSPRPESMTIRLLTLLLIVFLPGHHPVTQPQVKKFQIMPQPYSHSNRQKMRAKDGYPSPPQAGNKQTNGKKDSTRRKEFWHRSGPCSLLWLFSESVSSSLDAFLSPWASQLLTLKSPCDHSTATRFSICSCLEVRHGKPGQCACQNLQSGWG